MPRKQHKYHYIYKTTCTVTGNYYIGMHSTSNLEDGYMGSGKRLGYSIRKHGKEKHTVEILEFLQDRGSLKIREKELVNETLLQDPRCMNLQLGGGGGFSSEDHRESLRKAGIKAAKTAGIKGAKIHSEKMKTDSDYRRYCIERIKDGLKDVHKGEKNPFFGKKHNEEAKQKMREKASKRKPEQNSQYGTCWITNGSENKKIKKIDDIPNGWSYGRKTKQL